MACLTRSIVNEASISSRYTKEADPYVGNGNKYRYTSESKSYMQTIEPVHLALSDQNGSLMKEAPRWVDYLYAFFCSFLYKPGTATSYGKKPGRKGHGVALLERLQSPSGGPRLPSLPCCQDCTHHIKTTNTNVAQSGRAGGTWFWFQGCLLIQLCPGCQFMKSRRTNLARCCFSVLVSPSKSSSRFTVLIKQLAAQLAQLQRKLM